MVDGHARPRERAFMFSRREYGGMALAKDNLA
jgi:hypothetical protein